MNYIKHTYYLPPDDLHKQIIDQLNNYNIDNQNFKIIVNLEFNTFYNDFKNLINLTHEVIDEMFLLYKEIYFFQTTSFNTIPADFDKKILCYLSWIFENVEDVLMIYKRINILLEKLNKRRIWKIIYSRF